MVGFQAGLRFPASLQLDPPMIVSGTWANGSSEAILVFDRAMTRPSADPSPWTANVGLGVHNATSVVLLNPTTVRVRFPATGPAFGTANITYLPPPVNLVGDPDGSAVESFTNYPLTIV